MADLKSRFLCTFEAQLAQPVTAIGATPEGIRMIADVEGGTVEGPRLRGTVARSGGDWFMVRGDGGMRLDVRATVITDDDSTIYVTYGGRLILPAEHLSALGDPAALGKLDPELVYFRTAPFFEAATDGPHAWLNNIVSVGVGQLIPGGVRYTIHEIL